MDQVSAGASSSAAEPAYTAADFFLDPQPTSTRCAKDPRGAALRRGTYVAITSHVLDDDQDDRRDVRFCGFGRGDGVRRRTNRPRGRPRVDRVAQPIIKGVTSGTEHDSVVVPHDVPGRQADGALHRNAGRPNLIVTARHCVRRTPTGRRRAQDGSARHGRRDLGDARRELTRRLRGKNGQAPDTNVEANGVAHGKRVIVDSSTNVCKPRHGVRRPDKDVAAPVSDPDGRASPSETIPPSAGASTRPATFPPHREVRSARPVGVGPRRIPATLRGATGDREFMTGEVACAGDSGGPAFAQSGAIVGIAARTGNGKPSDGNYATTCLGSAMRTRSTRTRQVRRPRERIVREAGHTIWLGN